MRSSVLFSIVVSAGATAARAQTHVVKKPESVVRAVGVYEWTGEEGKPAASRFVPVTIFLNGHFEDAGIYLARPVPFALDTGTIFEVRKAGVDEGTLELAYARHLVSSGNGSYDDGWLGVGAYKPKPAEVLVAAKKSGPLPKIEVSGGKGPRFSNQAGSDRTQATNDASGKPVDRSTAAGSGTTVSAAEDPDRPTMRHGSNPANSDPASTTDSASDDVERPTLKRRTPEQTHAEHKAKDQASVTGVGSLNDDPDRPNLHRGKPVTRMEEEDLPPLHGIPADMRQRVAVSDAKDRPAHDFARAWESDAERAEILARMQAAARMQLAHYGDSPKTATAQIAARNTTPAARAAAGAKVRRKPETAPPAPAAALAGEELKAYTLSYGGAATFVYEASTAGAGGVPRYVTVVAQRDPLGSLKVAMSSVTDGAHLDRTPWYRLVDVVDADASNRASLLFELRGQTTRVFALYRLIGAEAQQMFVTEPSA